MQYCVDFTFANRKLMIENIKATPLFLYHKSYSHYELTIKLFLLLNMGLLIIFAPSVSLRRIIPKREQSWTAMRSYHRS